MPHKRADISPYLIHLTRDYEGTEARDNLLTILVSQCIEARNPYGVACRHLEQIGCGGRRFMESQKVACFSETPLASLHGLIDPGVWRRYNFRPYGVAFKRRTLIDLGANPVWYLNTFTGRGGFEWLAKDVNALIDEVALRGENTADPKAFAASHVSRLTPFIETMGEWGSTKKDFSFEREWRFRGDFRFEQVDVARIVVPPGETKQFKKDLKVAGVDADIVRLYGFAELADPNAD
jgi:hypothetical protein